MIYCSECGQPLMGHNNFNHQQHFGHHQPENNDKHHLIYGAVIIGLLLLIFGRTPAPASSSGELNENVDSVKKEMSMGKTSVSPATKKNKQAKP